MQDLTNGLGVTSNTILMALFGLVLWVVRDYMAKLNGHIKKCEKRAVRSAATLQWVGDGMHAIAVKTGAPVPPKPTFEDEEEE